MSRRLFLLLIALVAMVISACAPPAKLLDETYLKDTSLISGEPCDAPCWNNITPGETSFRDALIIVQDDITLANVEEVELEEDQGFVIGFSAKDGNLCCQMYSIDGEVIDSILLQVAPQITLGEVIDKYGEPNYIAGAEYSEDQASIVLIYPDFSTLVYAYIAGAANGELSETSEIFAVGYSTDSEMQQLLNSSSLYNWEGYQSYTDYVDENYDFVGENVGETDDASSDETEPEETEDGN